MRALMSCEPGGPGDPAAARDAGPVPGAGQILVAVRACGVNIPHVLTIEDRYQVKTPRPFAPGGEVAGLVSAIGPGVTGVSVGDRVAARTGTGGMRKLVVVNRRPL